MKSTAQSMTDAMIYMKFLQGIFVVGAVGGAWDVVYMNRITDYAIPVSYTHLVISLQII